MISAFAPLADVVRGETVESIHHGAIAVVNLRGEVVYHAGDPHHVTFARSSIKPFQALPFLAADGAAAFGFGPEEIALFCASHSGEERHVAGVRRILQRIGCDEHHLQCGCHLPLAYSSIDQVPPGAHVNQLHHNCSGKHAGFLAYCVQHNLPLETYLDPDHPHQRAVRTALACATSLPESSLACGTDGCSAPNYALPLSGLAYAYARLAQGGEDPDFGKPFAEVFQAMTTHPELVSGTGRGDLALMQTAPRDWVAKAGAEGVQAIGIRSAGLGIAIKVADGNARALLPAAISVLLQLELLRDVQATPLSAWSRPALYNLREIAVGEIRPTIELQPS